MKQPKNSEIMKEMEDEKVDVIGSFVREMNSVVTFRSKFRPQEGEFHRSSPAAGGTSVSGQDMYGGYGARGGDADTIASTVSTTSLQSSLLTQGRMRRNKGESRSLTQAHFQYHGGMLVRTILTLLTKVASVMLIEMR